MDAPDTYTLTAAVGSAGSVTTEAITGLEGLLAATLDVRLLYGSGGTTCKVYVQTSTDAGETWMDVACAAFTTAGGRKLFNLSGLTPKTTPVTPTDGVLTDDTAIDGVLGEQFRLLVVSTGTYAGSTQVVVRMVAR